MDIQLAELEERCKSNSRRIDELVAKQNNLERLTTTVEVLATRMNTFESTLTEVRTDVRALNDKPGRRWDGIVEKVLMLVIAGVVAYVLTKIGF